MRTRSSQTTSLYLSGDDTVGGAGRKLLRASSRLEVAVRELALFPVVGEPVWAGEGEVPLALDVLGHLV